MTWFAASIIVTMRPIEKSSEPILVYENVVLIEAADSDEAWSKATVYATASIVADESLTAGKTRSNRLRVPAQSACWLTP